MTETPVLILVDRDVGDPGRCTRSYFGTGPTGPIRGGTRRAHLPPQPQGSTAALDESVSAILTDVPLHSLRYIDE